MSPEIRAEELQVSTSSRGLAAASHAGQPGSRLAEARYVLP
jgi:hypothetical protein